MSIVLDTDESRVLVLTATARDFDLVTTIFRRFALEAVWCANIHEICRELDRASTGAVLIAEEGLEDSDPLVAWLKTQPAWSDLPILVLARQGADSIEVARATGLLGNVTILERPVRIAALISAVQSALRARHRQFQIRAHLAEHEIVARQLRLNDQRKDEFLAILAHELRNPLAPISNALHILNGSRALRSGWRDLGEMMSRQVSSLTRLVDDLLEVSRVTRGQLELRTDHVLLKPVIDSALEAAMPLIDASHHHIDVAMPPEPIMLWGDSVRLAQIVSNLLNNAAKYTPEGGRIALSIERQGSDLCIQVTDNGIGIPTELQPQIFEMFMQADRSRSRTHGGLGIGLTLVKRLTELHGGTIAVFSNGHGTGTQFTVRLPIVEANADPIQEGDSDTEPDLTQLRILIADDNRDAADSLSMILRTLGASVRIAYGGSAALAEVDLEMPDIAILDIGMDDLDGMEVARRIRDMHLNDMTLIALTGWGQEQDVVNCKEAGFDHHMTKPVDLQQLFSITRAAAAREAARP